MCKAFFSSPFFEHFEWRDEEVTTNATQLIINFLNWLHGQHVCPEYEQDLRDARQVCELAKEELPRLAAAERSLPGDFNEACSTMFGGYYANRRPLYPNADWVNKEDNTGLSNENARIIWLTALAAHCSDEDHDQFAKADDDGSLTVGGAHQTGLEVVGIEFPSDGVKAVYSSPRKKGNFQPTGKLVCKRWVLPGAPRLDIPREVIKSREAQIPKR